LLNKFKKKIIKRFNLKTKNINLNLLKKSFKKINFKRIQIKKCLFSCVVPKSFKTIKIYFKKFYKIKCFELKNLPLNHLIKIKVNKKQIGSDRLANAIGVLNKKKKSYNFGFWYSNNI